MRIISLNYKILFQNKFLLACLLLTFGYSVFGQTVSQTFTSSGTFTVPAGVTEITVECWGGGGGGGGSNNNNNGGSGGGGGGYASRTFTGLTPGSPINFIVGAGGTAGAANGGTGGTGGPTTCSGMTANGGTGGVGNRGAAGTGGTAAGGTINVTGSSGVQGTNTGGNGGDGANGGAGGAGVTDGAGQPGNAPGGGGGGGENYTFWWSTNYAGGVGANGQVTFSWIPAYRAQFNAMNYGTSVWYTGETRTVTVTVTNTGSAAWTDASPDINIGVKWNADPDYLVRVNAGNLAPGETRNYDLIVTAPAAGTNKLTFDVVNEGNCWFGNNTGSCGPGNSVYSSPDLTIINPPANPGTIITTTSSYTVPPNVFFLDVECWGGGGKGGARTANNNVALAGGGGGAYSRSIISVTPGNTYTVSVGAGSSTTAAGGDSWFGSNTTVMAKGGNSVGDNSNASGAGGLASAGYGDVRYNGGNGATGTGGSFGGGGGSSAGITSAGNYANTSTNTRDGATAPSGGGNGGRGAANNVPGQAGTTPGGGGGGGYRNGGTIQTPGNGANGQVKITLPANVALASTSQIPVGTIYQGITNQPLFSFSTTVSTSHALLNTVTFNTSGTYMASDIINFKLWYSTVNDFSTAFQAGSALTTSLGNGNHTFTNVFKQTFTGTTGYFWITADLANNATQGATISVGAFTSGSCISGNLTYQLACISGSTAAGGVQTIQATPYVTISSDNPAVSAVSVNQGTIDQPVYAFRTAIANADAMLTAVSFNTSGTCTGADLEDFKLWYSTTNNFSSAFHIGSPIISSLGSGIHTFAGLSQTISQGQTGYFWITSSISSFPVDGHTLIVSAINSNNLTFVRALKSCTTSAGGTITIDLFNGILLGSNRPAVSANSILQESVKQPIYKFTSTVSGANARLTSLTFTTAGTYNAADVVNFRLWYSLDNSLIGASQIGSSITTGLGPGNHSFNGLNQQTNVGQKGFFWITIDIDANAVAGHTINVPAITTGNLTYASGSKSGIAYDGGVQTIMENIDLDGEGVPDLYDLDDDNDGIPDITENAPCNTTSLELFPNTDFSAGNTGFTSAYDYAVPAGDHTLWPEGLYTVVADPSSIHQNFAACGDHTSGSGNMMVVNANPVPEKVVWRSGSVNVLPNTDYNLSFWFASVTNTNPAQLIWNVNGENIGSQYDATTTNCQWVNAVAKWNSGNNTTAVFDIINLNTIAGGNDFAIDDISCKYYINCDSDGDGVQDRLDLDSDNDGIYDVREAGGTDNNNDGIIDSYATDSDDDGLADPVDNINPGSYGGYVGGTPLNNPDTDLDGLPNILDLDSDDDDCFDAFEAGFNDGDDDGFLGTSPVSVDEDGRVVSAGGYTTPANNNGGSIPDYIERLPFITTQPIDRNICAPGSGTTFEVIATNTGGTYRWQVSTDGGNTWSNVINGGVYSGATTNILTISVAVTLDYNGYQYRLLLNNPAYRCQPLISDTVTLGVYTGRPPAPGVITGSATVCPGVDVSYSIAAVPQAMSYTWQFPAGWTIQSGNNTTSIVVRTNSTAGTIRVWAVNPCGNSLASSDLAVSIGSPAPSFTTTPSAPYCQGTDYTYTTQSGGSNYIWTFSGDQYIDYNITSGGTSNDNSVTVRWMTTGNKTVTVNYTSGGCQGATPASNTINVLANIIINNQPVNPPSMCAGAGSQSISITTTPAATGYQWEVSVNGGVSWNPLSNGGAYSNVTTSTMTITNPTIAMNGYQFRCQATGICGVPATSNAATLSVNTSSINSQSTGAQTQCIGGTFSPISVTSAGTGLSYQWYSNTTASTSGGTSLGAGNGAQTNTYTPQSTVAGTLYYYCVVTGTCGTVTSTISGAFITNPATAITAQSTAAQTRCINVAFNSISVTAEGTSLSYQWYSNTTAGTTGGTSLGAANGAQTDTYTPPSTAAGTLYYYCVVTGTCGTITSSVSGAFIVNPVPVISNKTASVYSGVAFTVTPVDGTDIVPAGTTYSWAAPAVTGGLTGGTSGTDAANISGTLNNPTSSTQTATYTVTPAANGCTGSAFTVTVTVNAIPVISDMTATICSGGSFTSTPVDGTNGIVPPGTNYSWPIPTVTGGITGGQTGSGVASITGTLINPTTAVHTATYTVTPRVGSYTGSAFTLTVTVNPAAVVNIAGSDSVCEGTTLTLDAGAGFSTYAWSLGASTLGTEQTQQVTTQDMDDPDITSVTETYTVVVTNAQGCIGTGNHVIEVFRLPITGPTYHIPNDLNH